MIYRFRNFFIQLLYCLHLGFLAIRREKKNQALPLCLLGGHARVKVLLLYYLLSEEGL
jgi:hypothetical protein